MFKWLLPVLLASFAGTAMAQAPVYDPQGRLIPHDERRIEPETVAAEPPAAQPRPTAKKKHAAKRPAAKRKAAAKPVVKQKPKAAAGKHTRKKATPR